MRHYRFLRHLSSFLGRAVVFFFLASALLFSFYVEGNYQDFLGSTQLFLLMLLRVTLGLELASGVWYAGFLVYRNATERRPLLVRWVLLLLSMAACGTLLVALRFVQQWLQS
jgi:hypothetical protein